MQRKWKEKMLNGVKPSLLLRETMKENPKLDSLDLDAILGEEFPELPQEVTVINFLWSWNKSGSNESKGMGDEQFDALVLARLFKT
jgi:hypothetical protein